MGCERPALDYHSSKAVLQHSVFDPLCTEGNEEKEGHEDSEGP